MLLDGVGIVLAPLSNIIAIAKVQLLGSREATDAICKMWKASIKCKPLKSYQVAALHFFSVYFLVVACLTFIFFPVTRNLNYFIFISFNNNVEM